MNSSNDLPQENKNLNFLAVFIQLIGFMFLASWIFNAALLKRVDPAVISMNPLTALNFILVGMLILLKNTDVKTAAKKYAYLFISIILVVPVLLTLIDLVFKTTFNADRMFFDNRISTYKMSLATAINFIVLGSAFILLNFSTKTARLVLQYFVIACLYTSLIYFFGYLYNLNSLVKVTSITPMQLHTSILFIMVCSGLIFLNPNEGFVGSIMSGKPGGAKARKILPILVLIPVLVGFIRLFLQKDSNYSAGFYTAIFSVTVVLLSAILIWYFAKSLNDMDTDQQAKEEIALNKIENLERSERLLTEMGKMAKVGTWEIYLYDDIPPVWSEEIYSIYKFKSKELMTLDTSMKYYKTDSRKILMEHFHKAMTIGTPYDLELKLITSTTKEIWVHAIGKPIFDEQGQIIGVRGVLQDIDDQKRKDFLLQVSINVIEDQNKRLLNFSHTVSHNLMGHSKYLKSTLDLLGEEKSEQKRAALIENISETGESINVAIAHLNEVVRIETNTDHHRTDIKFEDMLKNVTNVLQPEIANSSLTITSDFTECEAINYLPAYLESIFSNLITNTIKYKQEGIPAVVNIKTNLVNNKPTLTFSDNDIDNNPNNDTNKGLGYKVFTHANAKGTWLSLTKSQVESLGGNIEIQSMVNQGTAFKITF